MELTALITAFGALLVGLTGVIYQLRKLRADILACAEKHTVAILALKNLARPTEE
jgi:hypothetical protein